MNSVRNSLPEPLESNGFQSREPTKTKLIVLSLIFSSAAPTCLATKERAELKEKGGWRFSQLARSVKELPCEKFSVFAIYALFCALRCLQVRF